MIARLRTRGIIFEDGLFDSEVMAVESRFAFRFPPDLRAFLQSALPYGRRFPDRRSGDDSALPAGTMQTLTTHRFPDWRSGDESALRDWFDLPRQGVVFDIKHNGFWLEEWGPRPRSLAEAQRVAEQLIDAAPRLVPVYMHRMMPAEPHLPGNPVFSVHQTDIIVYGTDLRDYLVHEFLMTEDEQGEWMVPKATRPIAFWDTDQFPGCAVWAGGGGCVFEQQPRPAAVARRGHSAPAGPARCGRRSSDRGDAMPGGPGR